MSIGTSLAQQFERTWLMLGDAVTNCSAEEWRKGEALHLTPARVAYHTIESAEFYARDSPDGFLWGHRFGADWEGAQPEQLPSQQEMLAYLDEVRPRLDAWLRLKSDQDMLAKGTFPWTGGTLLETMAYLLRHIQHHVAQLNAELQRRGLPVAEWR